ncbi:toll/interleukin-1 receptor domain-containing protein [Aquimarina sp. ERC-38]|uniref:toll/interleukin-1 receptor domain-containing protein n=1 Tax=Aquimarina sp. ERC-38 TaxID=2949996 RepID=UPI002246D668|nr:toll/interleukin-1 receptor domain-containing protein [Aquimarina sp. ERC-38]UZO79670.1 toll/interleukin-1 receptor domain-containing protein [Aquimarina sp. ERC-38]
MSQLKSAESKLIRLQKEKLNLEKQQLTENQKITRINGEITRIQSSMKNLSMSQLTNKLKQIETKTKQGQQYQKKSNDIEGKIIRKNEEIYRTKSDIERFSKQELDKQTKLENKRQKEQIDFQKKLQRELGNTKRLSENFDSEHRWNKASSNWSKESRLELDQLPAIKEFDFFVSHASEDKEDFVKPLIEAMQNKNLEVWYDEFELKVGDSLRRSIDKGLSNSKYGVVILSSSFFKKNWTQYELDGLVTKEMEGIKVILPIWHKVSKNEVVSYSPTLADKVALNSSIYSIDEIVERLGELLNTE